MSDIFPLIAEGEVDSIEQFLRSHCDPLIVDGSSNTLLHAAVNSQKEKTVRLILNRVKEIKEEEKDENSSFVDWLNQRNADGFTALHLSTAKGSSKIVEALVSEGADLSVLTPIGLSVLHIAGCHDNADLLEYFVKAGVDTNLLDSKEGTALHWAVFSGSLEAIDFLISHSSTLNQVDMNGFSPLHLAVISGKIEAVRKLIQNGARLDIPDKEMRTPCDIAKKLGRVQITQILNLATPQNCNPSPGGNERSQGLGSKNVSTHDRRTVENYQETHSNSVSIKVLDDPFRENNRNELFDKNFELISNKNSKYKNILPIALISMISLFFCKFYLDPMLLAYSGIILVIGIVYYYVKPNSCYDFLPLFSDNSKDSLRIVKALFIFVIANSILILLIYIYSDDSIYWVSLVYFISLASLGVYLLYHFKIKVPLIS